MRRTRRPSQVENKKAREQGERRKGTKGPLATSVPLKGESPRPRTRRSSVPNRSRKTRSRFGAFPWKICLRHSATITTHSPFTNSGLDGMGWYRMVWKGIVWGGVVHLSCPGKREADGGVLDRGRDRGLRHGHAIERTQMRTRETTTGRRNI